MSKSVAIPTNISMNRIAGLQASLQSIAVKDSVAIWINQRARSIGIRGDEANALRAQQSVVGVLQSISDSEPVNIDPHMTEVVSSETIIPQRHVTNNYTIPSGVPIGCLVGKNGYHVKHCMAEFRVKAWVTEETNLRLVGKTNEDIDRAETYFKALFVKYDNSSNCRAKLPIPDHIPVGFIIGKNGNQLRALSSRYKVSAWVELEDMTLNISGSSWSIAKAVKEAKSLFLHYEGHHRVQNMPLFVCYPEARLFTFAESTNQLDSQSVARPFQLIVTTLANYQVHSQISDSGFSESECSDSARWIKSFCPSAITTWAETEVAKSEIQSPQVRIQIGEIGFKLQKYGNVHPSMAYPWQQLRQFRRNVDFLAKFSPIVNINVPEIGRLYNQLCELIDVENPEIVFDAYLGTQCQYSEQFIRAA